MQREEQQCKTDRNSEACNDVCHTLIKCRLNAYIPGNHCTHKSACVHTPAGDLQKTAGKMHFLLFISISFVDSLMSFSKYPAIQKPHLFLRVEPVLAALHDGESSMVLLCKIADGFKWRQVVTASIEDPRRCRPADGMASRIAEIVP